MLAIKRVKECNKIEIRDAAVSEKKIKNLKERQSKEKTSWQGVWGANK